MDTTTVHGLLFERVRGLLLISYLYFFLGVLAFLANVFLILAYGSVKDLRQRYVLYLGLAVADMVNGTAFIFIGVDRLRQMFLYADSNDFPATLRFECALKIGNILQVIGSQWPAFITLALGVDRFIAVIHPLQYRRFKSRFFNGFLTTTFIISLFSLCIALIIGLLLEPNEKVYFTCNLSSAYGFIYSTYNYLITTLCHVLGFVLNLFAYRSIRKAVRNGAVYNSKLKQECMTIK
uniref:G-protein coupled receptors family 1 profile domain-containing protein n=1 Tax=Panagrolaimus sp. JU765 TaxID=591449 RepID=A0AC34QQL1_9BILA